MEKNATILVTGATGMVGSAIVRQLTQLGYTNIVGTCFSRSADRIDGQSPVIRYKRVDLTDQCATSNLFDEVKPGYVFLASAKVGGIMANNTYRGQFIYENIQMQNNIIHQSYLHKVNKLLFLGSSCIYPKNASQPLREEYLLQSELEYTNEPYAIAKIAGIKMCESYNLQYGTNFISVMPTNLYGPNDNYHLEKSHVLPALIRKIHLAKMLNKRDFAGIRQDLARIPSGIENIPHEDDAIEAHLRRFGISRNHGTTTLALWGTGAPMREFLHVDDMAEACLYVMEHIGFPSLLAQKGKEIRNTHINIGTGTDLSIADLACMVARTVGYDGKIEWDASKPDGTMRKLLDVSKLQSLGWKARIPLEEGVRNVYENYKK